MTANERAARATLGLFFTEAEWLVQTVVSNLEIVFQEYPANDPVHIINGEPELHQRILVALTSATRLKNLLQTSLNRGDETVAQYKTRMARKIETDKITSGLSFPVMFGSNLRNALEHFETRLDQIHHDYSTNSAAQPAGIAFNTVTHDLNLLHAGNILPIRVYEIGTETFHHYRGSINLRLLYQEAAALKQRLSVSPFSAPNGEMTGWAYMFIREGSIG